MTGRGRVERRFALVRFRTDTLSLAGKDSSASELASASAVSLSTSVSLSVSTSVSLSTLLSASISVSLSVELQEREREKTIRTRVRTETGLVWRQLGGVWPEGTLGLGGPGAREEQGPHPKAGLSRPAAS